jgi:thioesterase domain-containing protein
LSWAYSGLMRPLGAEQPLYGIQARGLADTPGSADAENPPQSIAAMAEDYLAQIRSVQPHGPYHLLGWSFGGLVAYEMATQLHAKGEHVAVLTLMDSYPTDAVDHPSDPIEQLLVDGHLLSPLLFELGYDLPQQPGGAPLDDAAVLLILHQDEGKLAGIVRRIIEAVQRVYENNVRLMRSFRPRPFAGDMLLFTAENDQVAGAPTPAAWDAYVTGRIHVHPLACAHVEMAQPEFIAEIGRVVRDRLTQRNT